MTRMAGTLLVVLMLSAPAAAADRAGVPQAAIDAALKTADCDDSLADQERYEDKPKDLTGGLTLVPILCYRGAYNYSYIFFAADPNMPAKARLLSFARPDGDGVKPGYDLVNYEYDPDDKTMTELIKDRGVNDCGSIGSWRWSGTDFALTAYWRKPDCDGEVLAPDDQYQVFPKHP